MKLKQAILPERRRNKSHFGNQRELERHHAEGHIPTSHAELQGECPALDFRGMPQPSNNQWEQDQ